MRPHLGKLCTLVAGLAAALWSSALIASPADDQYAVAASHFSAQRWELAAQEFGVLVEKYGDDARANLGRFYAGESLMQLERYSPARAQFDELLKRDPAHKYARQARFRAAEAAYLEHNIDDARRRLAEFVAAQPKDELAAHALNYLGELELAARRPAEASRYYAAALSRFPTGPRADDYRLGVARSLEQQGKLDEAAAAYQELAARPSGKLRDQAQFQLGSLENARGKYAEAVVALAAFRGKLGSSPLKDKAGLAEAWALYKLGRMDEAATRLAALVSHPTLGVEARYWLGLTHSAQSQHAKAAETLLAAAALDAKHPLAPAIGYQAGEALRADGQLEQADAQLDRVLARWPTSQWADDCAAAKLRIALARRDYAAAARLAGRFAADYPTSSLLGEALAAQVTATAKLGDLKKSQESLAALRSRDPARAAAAPALALAEAAYAKNEWATAGAAFKLLADRGATAELKARGLSGLAWTQFQQGQWETAAATFDRVATTYADNPLAAEAALVRGQALEKLARPEDALVMYERVLNKYPASTRAVWAMWHASRLHGQLGHTPAAVALLERILKEQPNFAEIDAVTYRLAVARLAEGRSADAQPLLQSIVQDRPQSRIWNDAAYRLAVEWIAAGKHDEANDLLSKLVERASAGSSASGDLVGRSLYLQGRIAITRSRWEEAAGSLERLTREVPTHELASSARYWIAECSFQRGRYAEALEKFEGLAHDTISPADKYAGLIALRRAQCHAQQNEWERALAIARSIAGDYPTLAQQYEADYLIGRGLAAQANFSGAREAYARVVSSPQGAKTETAAMSQWMIGESYFHQEDYQSALREYLRVEALYAYPRWQAAGLLQAGKCHEALGNWKEAGALYERLVKVYPDTQFKDEAARRLETASRRANDKRRT